MGTEAQEEVGARLGRELRDEVLGPTAALLMGRRDALRAFWGGALLEAAAEHMDQHDLTRPHAGGWQRIEGALQRSMQCWARALAAANGVITPGEVACYNTMFSAGLQPQEFAGASLQAGSPARQPLDQMAREHLEVLIWAVAMEHASRRADLLSTPRLTVQLFDAYKRVGERYVMSDRQTDRDELHGLIRGLSTLRLFAEAVSLDAWDEMVLYEGLEAAEVRPGEHDQALSVVHDWAQQLQARLQAVEATPRTM